MVPHQLPFLRQQFVHLMLLSTSQHVPKTAYDLNHLNEEVAQQIALYLSSFLINGEAHPTLNVPNQKVFPIHL